METDIAFDYVTEYAEQILTEKIISCEAIKLACLRHVDDLENGHKRGLYFDVEETHYLYEFFLKLQLWEGKWKGQPFDLELWQKFVIGSIFGWKLESGLRRFRTAYLEVARKNAKSTLAAGIGLYMLDADGEPGAQVYSAATKKEQAKIIFNCAKALAESSIELTAGITPYLNNLSILETHSKFEPLASDSKKADGFSVSCGLVDELHEHPNGGMMDVLETGTGARDQSLIFYITTAGQDRFSVCYEQHEYSMAILRGLAKDDSYFAMIYTLDKDDDWRDPKVWIKANPNLDVSQSTDDLIRKRDKAEHVIRQQTMFRRKHCDEWVGSESKWLLLEDWDRNENKFDIESLIGESCWGGLDLSSKVDITAFVLVFPPETESGLYRIIPYFWVPGIDNDKDLRAKCKRDRCPYDQWRDDGSIETTSGNMIDNQRIQNKINELSKKYKIREIGFDIWNATETALKLEYDGFKMVEVRQGSKTLSEPMKKIEGLLLNNQLAHNGHPVLRWMADNIVPRPDANDNIAPDKKASRQRIDGMVAMIIAMERVIKHQAKKKSVYARRGLQTT